MIVGDLAGTETIAVGADVRDRARPRERYVQGASDEVDEVRLVVLDCGTV